MSSIFLLNSLFIMPADKRVNIVITLNFIQSPSMLQFHHDALLIDSDQELFLK